MVIKQTSFKHGWFYHYRVHQTKAEKLAYDGIGRLKQYLEFVFDNCPNEYFQKGPRGSALKFKLNGLDLKMVTGHEVSELTRMGIKENDERYKSEHSKVQVFMLEEDDKTIAVEVPLWLIPSELDCYEKIFKEKLPLTGHIDLLRVEEDGNIWIWDYKPNAYNEKFAATQVFFYALMLSKRTGIPLERFRCGYFDSFYAFVFKPDLSLLYNEPLAKFV